MELKEFIKESLVQIVEGVSEAQKEVQKNSAVINPTNLIFGGNQVNGTGYTDDKQKNVSRLIEFDIAVTVIEGTKTDGKIGANIGVLKAGTNGQLETQNSSISRLKFSVPILFPGIPMKREEQQKPSCANQEYNIWDDKHE